MTPQIPKIIHHIWVGDSKMPDGFKRSMDRTARLHPEYEMKLWTEENLPSDFINQEVINDVYNRNLTLSIIGDLMRYELLLRHGGVYSDLDFVFMKSFDPIVSNNTEVLIDENSSTTTNAFIAVHQNHALIADIIWSIRNHYFGHIDVDFFLYAAGIFFFDERVKKWPCDIYIAHREYFVPFCQYWDWNRFLRKYKKNLHDGYFGIHFWAHKSHGDINDRMNDVLDFLEENDL